MIRTVVATSLTLLIAAPALADEASERAAADLLKKRMQTERPQDLQILESVAGKDIVVVRGTMDHIEHVLAAANIRHTLIEPSQVAGYDLNADQILMVNCPGNIPARGVQRIAKFVRAGGLLYTTDWALLNVVQKAFPGTIAHNGGSTADEVTPVRVHHEHANLMSNMLLRKGGQPEWWLEGGSYPIRIVDKQKVQILASSPQMGSKYKAAPVVVRFRWDDGEVIHVVSHFYRQIATRGPAVAAKAAIDKVDGLTEKQKKEFKSSAGGGVRFSDVESSYAFQQMTTNLVVGKAKRNEQLDSDYAWTPSEEVELEGRRVTKGDRLKVLAKDKGKVKVRDDRGNEGWLEADAVMAK